MSAQEFPAIRFRAGKPGADDATAGLETQARMLYNHHPPCVLHRNP
jgi:hypothetical protein